MSSVMEAPAAARVMRDHRSSRLTLAWGIAASLLLFGSGVLRTIQSTRHQEEKSSTALSPFPLKDLPKTVGSWKVEGTEGKLDDMTTRITGSTDYVIWKYKDDRTGTIISALILYGPAEPVVPHTPQVCYPSTGYHDVSGVVDHEIKLDNGQMASFRSNVFAKSGGRDVIRSIVYHSFRLDGLWSPGIAYLRFPRKNPGIFKVQIQRRFVEGEGNGKNKGDEPIEQFLKLFLPLLERQIANAQPAPELASPASATRSDSQKAL